MIGILAEVWCRMGDEPADGHDGLCTPHRAGAMSHEFMARARRGQCLDPSDCSSAAMEGSSYCVDHNGLVSQEED